MAVVDGCSNSVGSGPSQVRLFKDDQLLITATNRAAPTDTFSVTAAFSAAYAGRGSISLRGWANSITDSVFVLQPTADTSVSMEKEMMHALDFKAGEAITYRWLVRLKSRGRPMFLISVDAAMDSVWVPDSAAYFGVYSDVVATYLRSSTNGIDPNISAPYLTIEY